MGWPALGREVVILHAFKLALGATVVAAGVACSGSDEPGASTRGAARVPDAALSPGEPYPYSEPAPARTPTPIDGLYTRTMTVAQAGGRPDACRRCAPYRRDAGRSTITFEEGRYFVRLTPAASGRLCSECLRPPPFSATGHYRVSGDRLRLFNDPNCIDVTGVYTWGLDAGTMALQEVEDSCPYGRLRAKFLTATVWEQS
jgi:hypothetical protein